MARLADYIRARVIGCLRSALAAFEGAIEGGQKGMVDADPYASLQLYLHAIRGGQLQAGMSIEAAVSELRGQHVAMVARGNRLAEQVELLLADMATPALNTSLTQALKEWKEITP